MKNAVEILIDKGLRVTQNRIDVLNFFITHPKAYSISNVATLLESRIDRVSLYRCLMVLFRAKILYKVLNSEGHILFHCNWKYNSINAEKLSLHFKCIACKEITPLPELPSTYVRQVQNCGDIQNTQLLLEGVCKNCNKIVRSFTMKKIRKTKSDL